MHPHSNRRPFLRSSGAAVAALAVGTGAATAGEGGWTVAGTPTGGNPGAVLPGDIEVALGAGGGIIVREQRPLPTTPYPPRLRSAPIRCSSPLVPRFTLLPGHTTHTREREPERFADGD